jgi:iron complex transport system ATP-binding protein
VRLDGRRVRGWPLKKLAARMAYVPQQAQLSAAFTVREVVALGRYALPADQARIAWAMESMGVADLAERLFLHLSQGQRQRVTVARALAQVEGDGILVLDEPLSAMDIPHMLETMRLLRAMANHGGTILIALHDLDAVRHFGDHVWLLQGGRLISTGPPADVLSPDHLLNAFGARFEVVHGSGRQSHLVPVFEPAQL